MKHEDILVLIDFLISKSNETIYYYEDDLKSNLFKQEWILQGYQISNLSYVTSINKILEEEVGMGQSGGHIYLFQEDWDQVFSFGESPAHGYMGNYHDYGKEFQESIHKLPNYLE